MDFDTVAFYAGCMLAAYLIGNIMSFLATPQNAPKNGIQQADASIQIIGHIAVIPRSRAEADLLKPRAGVFHNRADDKTADKREHTPAVAELIQRAAQAERADAVDEVKRP